LPDGARVHVDKQHWNQIKSFGYQSVEHFIDDVSKNYNRIYQGSNGSLILVKHAEHSPLAYIQITASGEGMFYEVRSGHMARKRALKNKKPLWEVREHNLTPKGPYIRDSWPK
jgi:hypothetical protein